MFDDMEASGLAVKEARMDREAKADEAIYEVRKGFGEFLAADTKQEFEDRWKLAQGDIMKTIALVTDPVPAIIRRVKGALKPNGKTVATPKQATAAAKKLAWTFDQQKGAWTTVGHANSFECPKCAASLDIGFSRCACGSVWNSWAIEAKGKHAGGTVYMAREVPERDTKLANVTGGQIITKSHLEPGTYEEKATGETWTVDETGMSSPENGYEHMTWAQIDLELGDLDEPFDPAGFTRVTKVKTAADDCFNCGNAKSDHSGKELYCPTADGAQINTYTTKLKESDVKDAGIGSQPPCPKCGSTDDITVKDKGDGAGQCLSCGINWDSEGNQTSYEVHSGMELTKDERLFVAGWEIAAASKPVPDTKIQPVLEGYIAFLDKVSDEYSERTTLTDDNYEPKKDGIPNATDDLVLAPGANVEMHREVREDLAEEIDTANGEDRDEEPMYDPAIGLPEPKKAP